MTEQEYKIFNALCDAFYERCEYIRSYLYSHNFINEFTFNYIETYLPEGDKVLCSGHDYEGDYVYLNFPSYLIWASDEEIDQYINDELKKREEEKKREQQKKKEEQRNRELELLDKLEKKYRGK